MTVYTDTLRMTGIDPYHSRYNPTALDDLDLESSDSFREKDCILGVRTHIIADATYYLKQVNDAYKEMTGEDEDYASLTCFLEDYINSEEFNLEDVKDKLIRESEEWFEEGKQRKEGE